MIIVNADDWGRSQSETDAALSCYRDGEDAKPHEKAGARLQEFGPGTLCIRCSCCADPGPRHSGIGLYFGVRSIVFYGTDTEIHSAIGEKATDHRGVNPALPEIVDATVHAHLVLGLMATYGVRSSQF